MKNINIILIALTLFALKGIAQQDSQYTQYMYNGSVFNPAYIGSVDDLTAVLLHRNQWVGLKGAPVTTSFSIYKPIRNNLSLGVSVINDRIGPSDESTLSTDVGYTIKLNDNYNLSFGMKASAFLLNVDYNKLDIYQQEQEFSQNIENKFFPNIGAGLFMYNDNSYLGISIPNFLETKHYKDYQISLAKEKIHSYLTGGYVFDLNSILLKPAFLVKYVSGAPIDLDVSLNALFNEKFTLGTSYRINGAVSALAGFQINNQWLIGYSYDTETSNIGRYNSGSHEIFLKFNFVTKKYRNLLTPRFF